jgi:multiple sugar transport system substrate-binding protein
VQIPKKLFAALMVPLLLVAAACGSGSDSEETKSVSPQATAAAQPQAKADNPVDKVTISSPVTLTFYHTQTGPNAEKLAAIIKNFEAKNPNIKINAEFQDGYTNLYKKLLTSIASGQWPDMSVAYPNQISEYQQANAVIPLDDYITSEKYGLTKAEIDDFVESYLAESRYYPEYGNKYLSFPFTKSLLVMYYNEDALAAAGQKVPTTWDEFKAVCAAVTKGDQKCLSISVSASTFNGFLYTRGSKIISDDAKTWQMNQPAGVESLQLYEDLIKSGQAIWAQKANADQQDFGAGRAVFTMGSTSGIPFYDREVAGKFKWGIANLPHAASVQPVTVLYGASMAVFKSTPEKQLAAWQFIKYFSSPEVTADWGPASGYMPIRKSALIEKSVTDKIAQFPAYGVAVNQISPTAKPETSNIGTQDMRDSVESAITSILADPNKSVKAALDEAFQKAQNALKK